MDFFVFFVAFFCLFFSGFDVIRGSPFIEIECNGQTCPSVVYLLNNSVKLSCTYFVSAPNAASIGDAEWVKVVGSQTVTLSSTDPESVNNYNTYMRINVTVTSSGTYTCQYHSDHSIAQTVIVNDATTSPTSEQTTAPPTSAHTTNGGASPTTADHTSPSLPTSHSIDGPGTTDQTSSLPVSDGGTVDTNTATTAPSSFKALNPIIYTVVSAAILGTLTIVAIVTCWLRSRKNIHLQTLLPRNSPQDYLDFIQENEFTPMTTSEFLASLQERPPTYNESETIERQKRETDRENSGEDEGEDGGQQPPPLPPRNNPRRSTNQQRGSSSSARPVSSQHQQSSSRGCHNTSSSPTLPAQRQQGSNFSDTHNGRGSRSADVHMDAVLAAFVESIEIMEAQRTAISLLSEGDSDEDETSALNSSETSALLVGVVPSLDAVV